jgi:hypothetical protein
VRQFDTRLVESIARDTDTPIEVVRMILDEELKALTAAARIMQFVPVIASRRVRLRLRKD